MLELINLTKNFKVGTKTKTLFNNASLIIPDRVSVALLGKNGAGKSTLLRMLSGSESLSGGSIKTNLSFSWPIALQGGLQGRMSGCENAEFVAQIYGISDIEGYAKDVKAYSELGDDFYHPVKTYSHGMKARLAFAMSVNIDFDAYIVDEVVSVGDPAFREKATSTIKKLMETKSFFIVSHNMNLIKSHCQSAIIIDNETLTYHPDINEALDIYEKIT